MSLQGLVWCVALTGALPSTRPSRAAGARRVAEPRVPSPLPPARYTLAEHEPGSELRGIVLGKHNDKVFVDVLTTRPKDGGNRTARVVACTRVPGLARARLARANGKAVRRAALATPPIGSEVSVQLTAVQVQNGRLIASLVQRTAGSRQPPRGVGEDESTEPLELEQITPATELRGYVVSQTPYEAFVDCSVTRAGKGGARKRINARLPLKELAEDVALRRQAVRTESQRRTLRDGDELTVWALEALPSAGRLTVTMRHRSREAMAAERAARVRARRKKRPEATALALGTVCTGKVIKRLPYGCLVDVGARSPGLLHASAAPFGRATLSRLSVGEAVRVRVIDAAAAAEGERSARLGLAYVEEDEEEDDGAASNEATGRAEAGKVGLPRAQAPRAAVQPPAAKAEPPRKANAAQPKVKANPRGPQLPPGWDDYDDVEDGQEEEERKASTGSIMDDDLDDYLEDKYGY